MTPLPSLSPNSALQRSGTCKVPSRGRPSLLLPLALRARVLTGQPTAAELRR